MEFELVWGGDPEDLTVTTSGAVTVEALDRMTQSILADPRYRPALRVLLDHRRADLTGITTTEIRRRADLLERDAQRMGYGRVAVVVSGNASSGVGRMMRTLANQKTHLASRVFTEMDEARAWLGGFD